MEYKKVLNEQINKLNKVISELGGLDILHTEGILSKRTMQRKIK